MLGPLPTLNFPCSSIGNEFKDKKKCCTVMLSANVRNNFSGQRLFSYLIICQFSCTFVHVNVRLFAYNVGIPSPHTLQQYNNNNNNTWLPLIKVSCSFWQQGFKYHQVYTLWANLKNLSRLPVETYGNFSIICDSSIDWTQRPQRIVFVFDRLSVHKFIICRIDKIWRSVNSPSENTLDCTWHFVC